MLLQRKRQINSYRPFFPPIAWPLKKKRGDWYWYAFLFSLFFFVQKNKDLCRTHQRVCVGGEQLKRLPRERPSGAHMFVALALVC